MLSTAFPGPVSYTHLDVYKRQDYYQAVKQSCTQEKMLVKRKHADNMALLEQEHKKTLAKLTDRKEIKNEKYVYKNRRFDAKMELDKELALNMRNENEKSFLEAAEFFIDTFKNAP